MKELKLAHIDLFCGLGGVTKGLIDVLGDNYSNITACDNDKFAKKTYLKNFPSHHFFNDVREVSRVHNLELIRKIKKARKEGKKIIASGGSPCQGLSRINNKGEGFKCDKSILFFEFVLFLKIYKPEFFIFENVGSMSEENKQIVSQILGCEPVTVKSFWFGAPQIRERHFWVNWDVDIDSLVKSTNTLERDGVPVHAWSKSRRNVDGFKWMDERVRGNGIANTLITQNESSDSINFFPPKELIPQFANFSRKAYKKEDLLPKDIKKEWLMTPEESEEAHGLPRGWTEGVSDAQRYKQLGNAISPPVISFLISELKKSKESILTQSSEDFERIIKNTFEVNEDLLKESILGDLLEAA